MRWIILPRIINFLKCLSIVYCSTSSLNAVHIFPISTREIPSASQFRRGRPGTRQTDLSGCLRERGCDFYAFAFGVVFLGLRGGAAAEDPNQCSGSKNGDLP
jgi:hypothetical protein